MITPPLQASSPPLRPNGLHTQELQSNVMLYHGLGEYATPASISLRTRESSCSPPPHSSPYSIYLYPPPHPLHSNFQLPSSSRFEFTKPLLVLSVRRIKDGEGVRAQEERDYFYGPSGVSGRLVFEMKQREHLTY